MKYVAYDYDAQAWVEGEPAAWLWLDQIREELSLLKSPDGALYHETTRQTSESLAARIERLEGEAETLARNIGAFAG